MIKARDYNINFEGGDDSIDNHELNSRNKQ